jgi:prepilin-type N-terminal cleavage/methylation domain-containing protein
MLVHTRRSRARGFSIIELMAVVAIVGIISALAYAGVARYLNHSKTPEATTSLAAFENGSRVYFGTESDMSGIGVGPFAHKFCPTATAKVPTTVPKSAKAPGVWTDATWVCLKFTLTKPQAYQYDYQSNSLTGTDATYNAYAFGDLNGNGINSTFVLSGKGGANGEAQRASFTVSNEDE